MKKFLKIIVSFFLISFLLWVIFLNCKLYHQPQFTTDTKFELNDDVIAQLRFLKKEIHNGAAENMQKIYPEGFVFMNALYGLSWCEVAKAIDHSMPLYKEAHDEIQFAFNRINSEQGKSAFQKYLPVPYGVFYTGWNNYLLGEKLTVEKNLERDTVEMNLYNAQCREIIKAMQNSNTPFSESYEQQAWPCDMVVAVASLSFEKRRNYQFEFNEQKKWIEKVKAHLDGNGLIPHAVDYVTGNSLRSAEGNSQSLILNFLFEIDSTFARQQFTIYKNKFVTTRFGLPAIREFPDRDFAGGDIDSGPVIFGIGGAASIVGLRTMTIFGEKKTAIGLRNSIEAFGFPTVSSGEKKFLFGEVPMADAFIAWANSKEISKNKMLSTNENWRWKFQLYSFLVLIAGIFLFMKMWKLKFSKKIFSKNK